MTPTVTTFRGCDRETQGQRATTGRGLAPVLTSKLPWDRTFVERLAMIAAAEEAMRGLHFGESARQTNVERVMRDSLAVPRSEAAIHRGPERGDGQVVHSRSSNATRCGLCLVVAHHRILAALIERSFLGR